MHAFVKTTEYTVSVNMQDKRSGVQTHVDEWEQGQNSGINIESTVATCSGDSVIVIPRLHDTTGCTAGLTTGCIV